MELEQKYSIAYKGLKNGLHEVDFDVDGALFKAYESKEIKDGRCKVHVDIDKSDTQLILDVTSYANATAVWRTARYRCTSTAD